MTRRGIGSPACALPPSVRESGRDLRLSYKGGSNTVTVPTNVPVVTLIPATRAELTTGKKVFVVATPKTTGVYDGKFVVVEKDGVAPPM